MHNMLFFFLFFFSQDTASMLASSLFLQSSFSMGNLAKEIACVGDFRLNVTRPSCLQIFQKISSWLQLRRPSCCFLTRTGRRWECCCSSCGTLWPAWMRTKWLRLTSPSVWRHRSSTSTPWRGKLTHPGELKLWFEFPFYFVFLDKTMDASSILTLLHKRSTVINAICCPFCTSCSKYCTSLKE